MRNRTKTYLAAACVCMSLSPLSAGAAVSVTGDFGIFPTWSQPGPGDTDLGSNRLDLFSGVTGVLIDNGSFLAAASMGTGGAPGNLAIVTIRSGGQLRIHGTSAADSSNLRLSWFGGRTELLVTGAGSEVAMSGDGPGFVVGRGPGSASAIVQDGGKVTGVSYLHVGRSGSFGELSIDGIGSLVSITGVTTAAGAGGPFVASLDIGRDGTGAVSVRNGARVEIAATITDSNGGPVLQLGRGVTGSGTLNINGTGSVVSLSALSTTAGGGANEAFNPNVRIGRDGLGVLNITQGGKLLVDGGAISTVANSRNTFVTIGGISNSSPGGTGFALVSDPGSEIRLTGSDTLLRVGTGPGSVGQLTIANQGAISAMALAVGDGGATGILKSDNGRLNIAGQQIGDALAGAVVLIGNGGGTGSMTLANGSIMNLTNAGSAGAGVYLGGVGSRPLGSGSLTLTGGSQINVNAAPGLAGLVIGREGNGTVDLSGASTINIGDGTLSIARFAPSIGTLQIRDNSVVTAGWVGIGREKTATGDVDGGIGALVLTNGTLNAQTIVVGSKGYLGGTGTIVGNITNYGTFSPGNSPGTLEIDGSFTALAGSKMILEVASNGLGGYNTDLVIFKGGQPLDLANLNAEFRFLGNTDPNAFGASGLFNINTFYQERQTDNSLMALAPSVFTNAVFTAHADDYQITSFAFSAASGGTIIAAAVPEPETWAMMLAGLGLIGAIARRRRVK
jgi:hypothetical protein